MTAFDEFFSAPWRDGGLLDRFVWAAAMVAVGGGLWWRFPDTGFVRDFLLAAGILGAASQLPLSLLPWVRLIGGATVATLGALTTLVMSDAISRNDVNGASHFWGALFVALALLVVAGWFTQMRILHAERAQQAARDQLASDRHAEVLAAVRAQRQLARPTARELIALALVFAVVRRLSGRRR